MTKIGVEAKSGYFRVGEAFASRSTKKKSRFIVGSHINPTFRGDGLGTELYKRLGDAIKANGGRFMQGHTRNINAIKKVRGRVAKTRVNKRRTEDYLVTTDLKKRKK